MARITIEDCLDHVENAYELVLLATRRVRQLHKGSEPLVKSKNRIIVTSLREIATGQVKPVFHDPNQASDDELAALAN